MEAEGRGHGGHRNGSSSSEGHIRRVPELCNPQVLENNNRDHTMTASNGEHDLKKWSELCKMQTNTNNSSSNPINGSFQNKRPESVSTGTPSSNHGDSNNNHSTTPSESGNSTVLPDMDFSN